MAKVLVGLLLTCSVVVLGTPFRRYGEPYTPDGRIIGGKDADIADYPYQLCLISDEGGPYCGAILLSPEWALTAAHCVYGIDAENITVRAGSSNSTDGGQLVNVQTIFQHKNFSYLNRNDDIALIKLSSNITVSKSKPIELATKKPKADALATLTGWGLTVENNFNSVSSTLQVVQVPIVDQGQCMNIYPEQVIDSMLCAGSLYEEGKGPCHGDSGGPLVVDGRVAGIVSWGGGGCGHAGKPGVFTDVSSYLGWIHAIISSN